MSASPAPQPWSLPGRAARWWLGRTRWLRAIVPLSLMAATWWSSSRTLTPSAHGVFGAVVHNTMHVVVWAVLAASLAFAVAAADRSRTRGTTVASLAIAIGYGLVDELHQSFVPGRVCSFADAASDAAGACFALSLVVPWLRGERPSVLLVGLAALAACACVALATWGPW